MEDPARRAGDVSPRINTDVAHEKRDIYDMYGKMAGKTTGFSHRCKQITDGDSRKHESREARNVNWSEAAATVVLFCFVFSLFRAFAIYSLAGTGRRKG